MNRTERRLARKRGGPPAGPKGSSENSRQPDIAALFAAAAECFRNGALAQANDLGRAILAREPSHPQTLNLLGIMAQQAGRNRAAVKLIAQAIAQDPNDGPFHYNIGLAYQGLGETGKALGHFERAVSLKLKDETVLINDNPFLNRCIQRIEAAWPRRLTLQELFGDDGIDAFVADNLLFRSLLQFGFAHDHILERFLTEFRAAILQEVTSSNADKLKFDDDVVGFLCAMAQQCFRNGYVFALTSGEMESVRLLHGEFAEKLSRRAEVAPLMLVVIATYAPLYLLPTANAIADRTWPEFLQTMIAQQLTAPREEIEILKTIQSLTSIDDSVSRQVQQQYEESPYPAWTTAAPTEATSLDGYVGRQLLRDDLAHLAGVSVNDVLIAGCGTGHHSLKTARAFPGASVLAVDISRTSLSYAIRKTREIGVENIQYAHADILKLDSIGRSFDLIESIGVLHHLSDPIAGWKVLLRLLRPGGVIGIGLYSERARRAIVSAHRFIAERGYRPVIEDIRAARQELIRRSIAIPSDSVIIFRDFFDASGCRDLLFNVMEHRFTIPQIKSFLAENALTFLGFELPPQARARFLERFPGEESLADLDKWVEFEATHPETFVSMYLFYAQNAG